MEGIAQLQAGMAAIQAGLSKKASSAQESVQANIATSLSTVQDAVGAEVYLEKMTKVSCIQHACNSSCLLNSQAHRQLMRKVALTGA